MLKILFDKPKPLILSSNFENPLWDQMTIDDVKALKELMELWEEGHIDKIDLHEADQLDGACAPTPPCSQVHPYTITTKRI